MALRDADVSGWLRRADASFLEVGSEVTVMESHWRLHLASLIPIALFAAVSVSPHPPDAMKAQFLPDKYPSLEEQRRAKEFLQRHVQEVKRERGEERGMSRF